MTAARTPWREEGCGPGTAAEAVPVAIPARATAPALAVRVLRRRVAIGALIPLLFCAVFAVYLFGSTYQRSGDTIPNELLPVVLLRGHGFDFTSVAPPRDDLPYWYLDVGGRIVSNYPIVPGLLNLAVVAAAMALGVDAESQRYVLSHITAAFLSALSVVLMFACLRSTSRRAGTPWLFTFLFALATNVWTIDSRTLWQHGPSIAFENGALALLLTRRPRAVIWAGLLIGLAIFNRPANAVILWPLVLYAWQEHRQQVAAHIALLLVPLAAMSLYSAAYLGSVAALGQGQGLSDFTGNVFVGLAGLLLNPNRGLLVFTPVFVFGLAEAARVLRGGDRVPLYRYLSVSLVCGLLLYARWRMWWGGHGFGYRLLMEIVPPLLLLTAGWWDRSNPGRALSAVFATLCALSLYVQVLGAVVGPCGFDTAPEDIDLNTARLWDVGDGELRRCTDLAMMRMAPLLGIGPH